MELILWRHAEAEDVRPEICDDQRELTVRGKRQAEEVAAWLLQRIPEQTRIVVSPAQRTIQTADALKLEYKIVQKIGTAASPDDLIDASGWPDGESAALLIGHQPTLGQLTALLLTGSEKDLQIKKGAVCWLSGKKKAGRLVVTLRAMIEPGMLWRNPQGSRR